MPKLRVRTKVSAHGYELTIGSSVLTETGRISRKSLGTKAKRIALVSNRKVFMLYGPRVVDSLRADGFIVTHYLIGDGERQKTIRTAEKILQFLSGSELGRTDAVVALGGGVVGDLTGFAASIFLRGLPFIQIPTTLLAQLDSSIGGKTGINLDAGKNLAGTFHQPHAVVIDLETLLTLPKRELVAGWCETVKQAAVGSKRLFSETVNYLRSQEADKVKISQQLERLVVSHCKFKAAIVAGDERENPARTDARSRRILNFGHTIAHALETITGYRYFRHGEAVGYGMLAAGALSKNLGMLRESELELLIDAVRLCGPLPSAKDLDVSEVIAATRNDKKRVAGKNHWVLLERIGRARIVNEKDISPLLIKKSLKEGLSAARA